MERSDRTPKPIGRQARTPAEDRGKEQERGIFEGTAIEYGDEKANKRSIKRAKAPRCCTKNRRAKKN